MIISKISCQYFLNFGKYSEIYFEEDQKIISIIGKWDNSKNSNRSGKSSFLEMIVYVLYGKTRVKKEIDLINKNYSDMDMFVEIEFDNEVVIRRGRTSNNEIILDMTNFEGADKKVIQEEIIKLTGMNYDDFIMTSFFLQGQIHTFMDAGSTQQKQIMAKWLEKDYWKIFEKNAKDKVNAISTEIIKLQVLIDSKPEAYREGEILDGILLLKSQKITLDDALKALQAKLEAVNEKLKSTDKIIELNKQIKIDKEDIEETEEVISDYAKKALELGIKLKEAAKNIKRLLELNGIDEELLKDKKEILGKMNIENKSRTTEMSDLKSAKKQILNSISKIDEFDSICPVTLKQCNSLDSIDSSKSKLKDQLKIIDKKIIKLNFIMEESETKFEELLKDIENIKQMLQEIKDLNKNVNLKEINLEISLIVKKHLNQNAILDRKKNELVIKENKLLELNKIDFKLLKDKKIKINSEIDINKASIGDIINSETKLKVNLEIFKQQTVKAQIAEKEMEESNKLCNMWKYVSFMFGKNGIPFVQIETAFSEIEEEANIILESINSDISIEFAPDKESNAWESNCLCCGFLFPKGYRKSECQECNTERTKKRKDELNIIIHTSNGQMDFCSESGGGKVLISLAIRLAFVRLLQRRNGINLQIICLDEICGELDETNRNYVLKMFSSVLVNEFNFSQVFVISHNEDIRDVIPDTIEITRYDTCSTFCWK